MAIDPSISLDVRPPQFNVQIPQPLQQFGQVLNLQNLMQQQQLYPLELETKKLGLDQARLAYQQALGLANLFQNPGGDTTPAPVAPAVTPAPAAPAPPGTFMLGQGQSGAPVHSLDGGANWANSITGTPYSGPRYGEAAIPAAPLGAMDITPPDAAPPVSAPPVQPAAAPATTPPAAASATAPALPSGGLPGLPSWQRMIQVGGASAFPWIKNINEAQKSQLDLESKQLELAQAHSKDAARILNGMTDNESKNRLLPEAAAKGYITSDEARQFYNMDFNDPRFQARKDSESQQALTYDQTVKMANERNQEMRAQNEEVRKWLQETDRQHGVERTDLQEKVKAMSDPSQFAAALNTPYLKSLYGGLVGKSLDDIKLWTGAGKPGETVPKPQSVVAQETGQAIAKAGGEATARTAAEDQPYQGIADLVKTGKLRWDQVPDDQKPHVGRLLSQQGSTPQFTKPLTDTESKGLNTLQNGLAAVTDLKNELSGPKRFMTGPWADTIREIPVLGAKWEGLQGKMGMLQATVGDLIKGGVLRASDQKVYESMFPNMTDDPWTVREKLGNLETKLTGDLARYKESLRGQSKFIPGETPPAAPGGTSAAPAPAGPSYQTIEKTGAPGPRVTGTFTIGGGAIAAPPGKIVVQAPASRGGGKYYLDSDKWPQYQKQGFTRAE